MMNATAISAEEQQRQPQPGPADGRRHRPHISVEEHQDGQQHHRKRADEQRADEWRGWPRLVRRPSRGWSRRRMRLAPSAATITIPSTTRLANIRSTRPAQKAARRSPRARKPSRRPCGCARFVMRETRQPTSAAIGSTRISNPSTNHSLRVGWPLMSMVCLPLIATTRMELAMNTAKAASAGADRGHSRRTSAPGRSTAGRPRSRNHRSAARRLRDLGRNHRMRLPSSVVHGPPLRRTAELNRSPPQQKSGLYADRDRHHGDQRRGEHRRCCACRAVA